MKGFTHGATVTDAGRLEPHNLKSFREAVHRLPAGEYWITVEPRKVKRSLDQNAYWWAAPVKILAEHCGYTDSQMHYALLGECFGFTAGPTGQPVPVKPSSSELSVDEFKKLIDWVLVWAPSELGVVIPEPNEWERVA